MAVGGLGVSGRPLLATLLLMCGVVALPRASFVSSWAPERRPLRRAAARRLAWSLARPRRPRSRRGRRDRPRRHRARGGRIGAGPGGSPPDPGGQVSPPWRRRRTLVPRRDRPVGPAL